MPTVVARSGVGAFVRRGDPKPDISDVDAFVRALRNAKVITYSDPALGGSASNYVASLLAKLDTTGEIKAKTKLAVEYRSIANIVAAGGVDIALNQITEIMADPRLELIGSASGADPALHELCGRRGRVQRAPQRRAGSDRVPGTPAAVKIMRSNGLRAQSKTRRVRARLRSAVQAADLRPDRRARLCDDVFRRRVEALHQLLHLGAGRGRHVEPPLFHFGEELRVAAWSRRRPSAGCPPAPPACPARPAAAARSLSGPG